MHHDITAQPRARGVLQKIYYEDSPARIIVVVPGLDTSRPQWKGSSESIWAEIGKSLSSPVAVFGFEHEIPLGDSFQWWHLLESGPDLLRHLLHLRESSELRNSLIFFICHSLGGILVKQALCLASQKPDQYRLLMRNVTGACFLGTPHSTSNEVDAWESVKLILSSKAGSLSNKSFSSSDAAVLASVSRRFEEADIQRPVLSIFENRGTKIKSTFRPSKRSVLVDHNFARINVKDEKMLEVSREHHKLCNIPRNSFAFEELLKFIHAAFENSNPSLSNGTNGNLSPSLKHLTTTQSSNSDSVIESPGGKLTYSKQINDKSLYRSENASLSTTGANLSTRDNSSSNGNLEFIPNLTNFTPSKKLAKLPCYLTSSTPNPKFFGREDVLKTLKSTLLPKETRTETPDLRPKSLRTFALCAPGGMGKTQIADKFVQIFEVCYDAIFWIHADQTSKLAEGFSQIALRLGLVEEGSTNARDQTIYRDLAKAWLANPVKQLPTGPVEANWLIVFDNVDDPDLLNDFWPVDGMGSILVTSRNPLAKTNVFYAGTSGIDLPPFSFEDAAKFLLQLTGRQENAKQLPLAYAVAERLGGIPLAITQMASLISRQQLSFEEFLLRYNNEENMDELHSLRLGGHRDSYSHTLATVWGLDRLEHGMALLEVLSLLDPDKIEEHILLKGSSKVQLSGYPTTAAAYQNARYELLHSSLVTRDIDQGRLLIHRVIQDSAKAKMTPQRLAEVFEAAVELLRAAYPATLLQRDHSPALWIQCEPLFLNIIRLKEHYQRFEMPSNFIHARLAFAEILNEAGWFHHDHERRNSAGAGFFELAQSICESISPGPDDDNLGIQVDTLLGDIHYSRGCVASETNDANMSMVHFGAFTERRLKLSNRPGGKGKDINLARAYNEEGNSYMISGKYEDAKDFYYKSMDTYKSLLEFSRPMMSLPMVNLGLANWLLGDLKNASEILELALLDREKAYGVDDNEDFQTGRILHALGNVRMSQGQLDESFRYHQRALQQYKSTIGNSHHRTADVCHRLADHYARLGKSDVAITLLDQALKNWADKRHYRPERARTSYKKSLVLRDIGKAEEARQCLEHALLLRRDLFPKERQPEDSLTEADFDNLVVFWSK